MIAFQARVQQARRSKTTPSNSAVGDHQATGRAEKGVQAFQNMARRIKLALEAHLGIRLPHKHPVLMWLIEWVGGAHNRFKDGRDDGKTPRERAGWQSQSQVLEFGEMVQFIPFKSESRTDKFDAKLREGVWLGLDSRTYPGDRIWHIQDSNRERSARRQAMVCSKGAGGGWNALGPDPEHRC